MKPVLTAAKEYAKYSYIETTKTLCDEDYHCSISSQNIRSTLQNGTILQQKNIYLGKLVHIHIHVKGEFTNLVPAKVGILQELGPLNWTAHKLDLVSCFKVNSLLLSTDNFPPDLQVNRSNNISSSEMFSLLKRVPDEVRLTQILNMRYKGSIRANFLTLIFVAL